MYLFQSVFNFFVVSGSGQAAITMPIMAPLADLLGVTPSDFCTGFPVGGCIYEFNCSNIRLSDRFPGDCQDRMVQLDQIYVEVPWYLNDRCGCYHIDCSRNRFLKMRAEQKHDEIHSKY